MSYKWSRRLLLPTERPDRKGPPGHLARLYGDRRGALAVKSLYRKSHALAEDGNYYIAATDVAGVNYSSGITAIDQIAPWMVIQNLSPDGGKRMFLDYLKIITISQPSSGISLTRIFTKLDVVPHVVTGGMVLLLPQNINMNIEKVSVANIILTGGGTLAIDNGMGAPRLVHHDDYRTSTIVAGDQMTFSFGAKNLVGPSFTTTGSAIADRIKVAPPIIIGPQQSLLQYFHVSKFSGTSPFFYVELGWWER